MSQMCALPGCLSEANGGVLCAVHASEPTNLCARCKGSGLVWRCGDRDSRDYRNFTDKGTCGTCSGTGLADKKVRQAPREASTPVDQRGLIAKAETGDDGR